MTTPQDHVRRTTVLHLLISSFVAMRNCERTGNAEWLARHEATIEDLAKNFLPSGSGFDSGTKFDFDKSSANRLWLHTSFHHMNESGMYDGWTEHRITIAADLLSGFRLTISGPNRNDIKEYMHDVFHADLTQEIEQHADGSITRVMDTAATA